MNTAGGTTGWVNYANKPSQAALERSSQDALSLRRHQVDVQQGGCVDSRRCGAFDQFFSKTNSYFIYFLHSVAHDPEG